MTLADIARDMEVQAKRRGASIRDLPRGLRIELTWVGGNVTLALSRPVTAPSEDEISLCRHAFGVPLAAERTDGAHTVLFRWPS